MTAQPLPNKARVYVDPYDVDVQLNRTLPILSFPSLTTEGEPRHLRGPR